MQNNNLTPIPGYEDLYSATPDGRIWSCRKQMFMKTRHDKDGYTKLGLYKDGKQKTFQTHQLIALTFIPNPLGLTEVNHINSIRDDNRVENLEWITHKDNLQVSKACRKTRCVETGEVFPSASEAARAKGIGQKDISKVALGQRKTAGGYHWEYID